MNWKALRKTFSIDWKSLGMFGLYLTLGTIVILGIIGALVGVLIVFFMGLEAVFGESIATIIVTLFVLLTYFLWIVVEPLVNRYRRFKREIEG